MRNNFLLFAFLVAAFVITAALSGCATKHVVKDCEKINDSNLFICKKQYGVWN